MLDDVLALSCLLWSLLFRYDEAAANYRQAVLVAFQNVADSLKALEADARTLEADANASV